MSKEDLNNSPEFYMASMGRYGYAEVDDVATVGANERFCAIEIMEDGTTFTATADGETLNPAAVTAVSITGDKTDKALLGVFDNLAVSAGSVRAYYSDNVDRSA